MIFFKLLFPARAVSACRFRCGLCGRITDGKAACWCRSEGGLPQNDNDNDDDNDNDYDGDSGDGGDNNDDDG